MKSEPPRLRESPDLPGFDDPRLRREWRTLAAMVRIFCRDRHQTDRSLCAECSAFLDYAAVRLDRCRFGTEKPTCAKCPVHCYQPERREQARTIMRYAGPRMLIEHPWLSLRHWLDTRRQVNVGPGCPPSAKIPIRR